MNGILTLAGSTLLLALLAPCATAQDRVTLKNGEVLEGKILEETDSIVTLRSGRIEMTLGRDRILELSRVVPEPGAQAVAEGAAPEPVPEESRWFAVRDGAGRIVGALHRLQRIDELDGVEAIRLEEHFLFRNAEGKPLNVHVVEWASPALEPLSFHYREWEGDDGFVYQGKVGRGRVELGVVERDGLKRTEEQPFPSGTTLPLIARLRLLQEDHTITRRITLSVYDYHDRRFVARNYLVGTERTTPSGQRVRVFASERHGGALSEEWIDPARGTVRLEVNGPYLVAEPTVEDSIQAWIEGGGGMEDASTEVRGGRGAFRLFLPNPAWRVLEARPEDSTVTLRRDEGELSAVFLELGDLDPQLTPEGALLELERRMRDLPGFRREGEMHLRRIGRHDALQLDFEYRNEQGGVRSGRIGLVHRTTQRVGFVLSGPRRDFQEAAREFDRLVGRFEFL